VLSKLYDLWVMPLTKDVEVEYLLRRLDWSPISCSCKFYVCVVFSLLCACLYCFIIKTQLRLYERMLPGCGLRLSHPAWPSSAWVWHPWCGMQEM
jgi:hypothetical protein